MNGPRDPGQNARGLAKLFSLDTDPIGEWTARDYSAVWRHQLSQPLLFDTGALREQRLMKLELLAEAEGLLLKSVSDVLNHQYPPVELLLMLKDFAKANRIAGQELLPKEIAAALYYASIAAALVRRRTRISRLSDPELEHAFAWALAQDWIDADSRELFRSAAALVQAPESDG